MPTAQDSTIFADKALLPTGWAENVRVDFSANGEISAVETNAPITGWRGAPGRESCYLRRPTCTAMPFSARWPE
jgi:uncharacterized protein YfaP (DUF2135 family)